jgi:Transposase DDE domain
MKNITPPQPKQPYLISPHAYLFVTPPNSELTRFIEQALRLVEYEPQILSLIQQDMERHGLEKKSSRLADRHWHESQSGRLPGQETVDFTRFKASPLQTGRPRMTPRTCFLFLMLRGYLGGFKTSAARTLFEESTSIRLVLEEEGIPLPGLSTLNENANAISNDTRDFIHRAQLRMIRAQGLDDLLHQKADSTAVSASTSWPSDSRLIVNFLDRALKRGQSLEKFELPSLKGEAVGGLIKDMRRLEFQIAMVRRKTSGERKRRDLYLEFIELAEEASQLLTQELSEVEQLAKSFKLAPSEDAAMKKVLGLIGEDIIEACKIIQACIERVVERKPPKSGGRRLSLGDKDAAYIVKGTHDPVIGYRVQVVSSGKGFITDLKVPKGNASDAQQLVSLVRASIKRLDVVPVEFNVDSGYACKDSRVQAMSLGVQRVVIGGSKGRAITDLEEWESEAYKKARRMRSAIESVISQLKGIVGFGRAARRTIAKVTAELTEKVLAFNFRRITYLSTLRTKGAHWPSPSG